MERRLYFSLPKNKIKNVQNIASYGVIVVLIINFLQLVINYAVNVPNYDDFTYFDYTRKLINSNTIYSFLDELISKHNGHGVLVAKLIFYLNYLIAGEINFQHLIILGSFLILPIFCFFVWLLRKNSISIFFSLPIALFLFNLVYYENILWAAATWQYTASLVTCLTMYFLLTQKEKAAFVLAIILGFITTYTNGNGIVGFFLGIIIIFPQKNYRRLSLWLLATLVTAMLFYMHSSPGFGTQEGHKATSFFKTLISFMATVAIYLRLNMNDVIIAGISIVVLSVTVLAHYSLRILFFRNTGTFEKNPANLALLAIIAWLFFTGICVAWTRGMHQFAIVQRYMIYSVMNLVVLYSLILIISPVRYRILIGMSGIIIGIVLQLCTNLYILPNIIYLRNSFWSDVYNLKNHQHLSGKIETMSNKFVKIDFNEALEKSIYNFPEIPIPDNNAELLKIQNPVIDSSTKFSFKNDTLKGYSGIPITSISNDKITLDESHPDNSIFMALKDEKTNEIHLIPTKPSPNLNRKQFLTNGNHFNPGIQALVYEGNVTSGKYIIGLLTLQNQSVSLIFTNQEVEIGKIY